MKGKKLKSLAIKENLKYPILIMLIFVIGFIGHCIYVIFASPFLNSSHRLYEYIETMQESKSEILDTNITVNKGDFFVSDEVYLDFDLIYTQNKVSQISDKNKIVVQVIITPLNKTQTEWKYFKGNDTNFYAENARTLNDNKFSIISDLSTYDSYDKFTKFGVPNGNYGNFKKLTRVELSKGKYNIKVKLLEFQNIDNLIIYLKINELWKKTLITF